MLAALTATAMGAMAIKAATAPPAKKYSGSWLDDMAPYIRSSQCVGSGHGWTWCTALNPELGVGAQLPSSM